MRRLQPARQMIFVRTPRAVYRFGVKPVKQDKKMSEESKEQPKSIAYYIGYYATLASIYGLVIALPLSVIVLIKFLIGLL